MTDPEFRAAKPKPPAGPPKNGSPDEPDNHTAVHTFTPFAGKADTPSDPLQIMRHITYALRPLSRESRRMVLETLLEISE